LYLEKVIKTIFFGVWTVNNFHYGKYSVPQTLLQVIDLQAELAKEGLLRYGDLLGYYFSLDEIRYLNTPLDLLSFANPGGDGIHYGFLTDFGLVGDLEDAYIVRVSPMDFDDPVKIVARNLRDFLRMMYCAPASLDLLDINSTEAYCKEMGREDSIIIRENQSPQVRRIFMENFQLEPIQDIYSYLTSVKNERSKQTVLRTNNGLEVVNKISSDALTHMTLELNRNQTLKPHEVKAFFEAASPEAKLGFLRDAQSYELIFDNEEVKEYLREQLLLLNLVDEAERIMFSY
jgi:hypothetical protein